MADTILVKLGGIGSASSFSLDNSCVIHESDGAGVSTAEPWLLVEGVTMHPDVRDYLRLVLAAMHGIPVGALDDYEGEMSSDEPLFREKIGVMTLIGWFERPPRVSAADMAKLADEIREVRAVDAAGADPQTRAALLTMLTSRRG